MEADAAVFTLFSGARAKLDEVQCHKRGNIQYYITGHCQWCYDWPASAWKDEVESISVDCAVGSLSTIGLSGDVEPVCVPQTTPGKPDLYSGADFFDSFYRAVLDIVLMQFVSLVFAVNR